ncbi:MAG: thymidine phosphorylase [Candidatus Nanoarchaeia archaeon]|nr:thymidine phosphorylase [Candidatus Nanoarchaeia archaeon]
MKLKVKEVGLSTGHVLVAVLSKEDAKRLDVSANDRIDIKGTKVIVNISHKGIGSGTIGLFEESLRELKLKPGNLIDVKTTAKPRGIEYIEKKLRGKKLNKEEIERIIKEITKNELNEAEIAYFISGCYAKGMDDREVVHLTNAMLKSGKTLSFGDKKVLDKHCIGGIPGNRTSMIMAPIIASAGYIMPKTSTRSITSPSGTADTMETLADVSLSKEKIMKVIKKTNACLVWGGALELANADQSIIRVERFLMLDIQPMLLSSILSKKKSVNAKYVIIDIPIGKTAKIRDKKSARVLKRRFIKIGRMLGMKIKVVFTDGSQPVGNGIGPVLEAIDVLNVLKGDGPKDLMDKSIFLSTELLKLAGVKNAKEKVMEILDSGKAYEKMKQIIRAQGKNVHRLKVGKYFKIIESNKSGAVTEIDNGRLSKLARILGSPEDKGAGIYLNVKKGHKVSKKQPLFTMYAESSKKLQFALEELDEKYPLIIN